MTESCKFCNETEELQKHHIVPRRFNGSDSDDNLVKVCPTCHRKIENLYNRDFYETLGVKKNSDSGHGSGFYLVKCQVCDAESIDHRPAKTGKLSCNRCGNSERLRVKYRINEKFAEVVDLDNFVESDSNKEYMVYFRYSEEHTGSNDHAVYPRGSPPMTYKDRKHAYDKAQQMLLKDWCKSASVINVEKITSIEEAYVAEIFADSSNELSRLEDNVLAGLKKLDSESDSNKGFQVQKVSEEIGKLSYKVSNVLKELASQGYVYSPEEDCYAPIYEQDE